MAWPNTPLTTYIANTTPAIKASDLNAFQAAINRIINGTYSLKSVVIDGTGGTVTAPPTGTLSVTSSASAASLPGTAISFGTSYKEALIFGFARCDAAGTVTTNYNAKSSTPVAVGQYEVKFNGLPANIARATAQATGNFNAAARIFEVNSIANDAGDTKVTVFCYDAAGALANGAFYLHVWGG